MSYDDYEREYHLTPNGWVTGRYWYFGKSEKEVAPPSDRLLTVKKSVTQSSGWSREDVSFSEEWRFEGADEEIKKLKMKFPLSRYC